jgi:predicted transposase YdaD
MGIEEFLLDQAKKEGFKEGVEKGIAKGIIEGIEKGMIEGIEKEKKANALKMKANGLDAILIANITGISVEEIEKLN